MMNPFPKLVSYLALLSTFSTMLLTFQDVLPPKLATALVAVAGLLSALSHSLTGTGGKGAHEDQKGLTKNITTS